MGCGARNRHCQQPGNRYFESLPAPQPGAGNFFLMRINFFYAAGA